MIVALDFDGTCVAHDFPYIGNDIGAILVIKRLVRNGHKIILNTVRSRQFLTDAIDWFKSNGIELYGINANPTQYKFTTSPKVHADLFIDDLALGVPLRNDITVSEQPFVDWKAVEVWLENNGWLTV